MLIQFGMGRCCRKCHEATKGLNRRKRTFVQDTLKRPVLEMLTRVLPELPVDDYEQHSTHLPPCPGVQEPHLQKYACLPFPDKHGSVTYYLHVEYERQGARMVCTSTIRSHGCTGTVLTGDICCRACKQSHQLVLKKHARSLASQSRELKKNTPLARVSKERVSRALKTIRKKNRQMERQLKEIKDRLKEDLVTVSRETHEGLTEVMNTCNKDPFIEMFWTQQKKAFEAKSGGMRWHPMMIRFAILIHSQSPSAYRSLKDVGVLKLPSESTLRDYTNVLHPASGFQIEVFKELKNMTADLADNERWVTLLHDEITIKADLVYDKKSGELIGFIDSTSWNDQSAKDGHLASHALVFMVVGITSNIKMSIGYFPTRTATADQIFPLLWQAIGLIECVSNLKVIASTSDKASPNQRLIRMHGDNGYKAQNLFAPHRSVFFFSDAPHLIKTVRNNLASSGFGSNTRYLWNNGRNILWTHIVRIYQDDSQRELKRTKLTADHIYLNPQSVMRIYLAAQVLSHSVGRVMQTFGNEECQETAKFILLMDKFFDCLNVRSSSESVRKNNQYLSPYTDVNDERFTFLREEFWKYIEDWRQTTLNRDGFSQAEKAKMFISRQTYEGLKTTVHSMIEATRYLLQSGVGMVLSNRFCQDPLEQHFGRHRSLGVRAENPTLWSYGYQENKIRLQRNLALSILPRGNIRGKRNINIINVDDTPLPKIRRH